MHAGSFYERLLWLRVVDPDAVIVGGAIEQEVWAREYAKLSLKHDSMSEKLHTIEGLLMGGVLTDEISHDLLNRIMKHF